MKPITLSQAIAGYLIDAQARRLSEHTLADYQNTFRKFRAFLGSDPLLPLITVERLREFFADLAVPRAPAGIAARPCRAIGKKQSLNIHTGLAALWTWCVRNGYAERNIVHDIQRPKPERPTIVPFSQDDIKRLLAECERSRSYMRAGQRITDRERPTAERDRALILLLLDTGVRASELCGLRLLDIDLRNNRITVTGKGSKERSLPIGPLTNKALFRYLSAERKDAKVNERAFVGLGAVPLNRDSLLKLLKRLGERAHVADVHPHRFRHTFAIEYLRNGGNTRALQEALGHETLEMIRTYTRIAEADLVNGHKLASPVENWRL